MSILPAVYITAESNHEVYCLYLNTCILGWLMCVKITTVQFPNNWNRPVVPKLFKYKYLFWVSQIFAGSLTIVAIPLASIKTYSQKLPPIQEHLNKFILYESPQHLQKYSEGIFADMESCHEVDGVLLHLSVIGNMAKAIIISIQVGFYIEIVSLFRSRYNKYWKSNFNYISSGKRYIALSDNFRYEVLGALWTLVAQRLKCNIAGKMANSTHSL